MRPPVLRSACIRAAGLAAAALMAYLAAASSPTVAAPIADGPYAPDAVLVAFRETVGRSARVSAVQRLGLSVDTGMQSPHFARLRLGSGLRARGASVNSVLDALRQDPSVRLAEPDYLVRAEGPVKPS